MTLLNTYEEYKKINNDLIKELDEIVEKGFNNIGNDIIKAKLEDVMSSFEKVKYKSDELIVEEANKDNLQDLKYLIVSGLFLTSDLIHFLNLKEEERFKMRAVNYINNNRRGDLFK